MTTVSKKKKLPSSVSCL